MCSRAAEGAPPALAEGRSQSDLADESAAARLVSLGDPASAVKREALLELLAGEAGAGQGLGLVRGEQHVTLWDERKQVLQ